MGDNNRSWLLAFFLSVETANLWFSSVVPNGWLEMKIKHQMAHS